MSILSGIKDLFKGTASKLGLDDALVSKLEELTGKLEGVDLGETVTKAVSTLKDAISGFKSGKVDASALLEKGKSLISKLDGVELPDNIKGLVEKVSALIK